MARALGRWNGAGGPAGTGSRQARHARLIAPNVPVRVVFALLAVHLIPVFAREGYPLIAAALALSIALFLVGHRLGGPWEWSLILLGVAALGFTLYFFRDPKRVPPPEAAGGRTLLAPADGKVVEVRETQEPLYLKGPALQISIFLSPLDVHVNRVPADGVIEYVEYVPGDYLVAWHPKASEKNERSQIGLRHPSGTPVLFKQIAGAVARRIVYHLKEGDVVQAGDRFGIVKFGSRMDVLVPPGTPVHVQVGDRVTAGVSILGTLPPVPAADPLAPAAHETPSA
ncbi:phosphatidylserine decarboxylase [Rhodothermaceae bacterium RA]|nr:phosphatidylserine decarboxylase [Rhodothermaceae bacterium RA]